MPSVVKLVALVVVLRLTCAQAAFCGQVSPSTHSTLARGKTEIRTTELARLEGANQELQQALTLRNKLTQHDVQAAIYLLTDSARKFVLSAAPGRAAYAQLEAGDTYQMMSRYREALTAYQRSITLAASNLEARCAAIGHIIRTYANIGSLNEARKYGDEAAALCGSIPDKKILADVLEAEGELSYLSSNMPEAINDFTDARKLDVESNDVGAQALNSLMLAQALNRTNHQESTRLAWDALKLWLDNKDAYGAARAHLFLAYLSSGEGNLHLAQCHSEVALSVFQRIADRDNVAIASNLLGMLSMESGELEASYEEYRRALDNFAAAQDTLGEAESIEGMARILVIRRDYVDLLSLYRRKLVLAKKTGYGPLRASALVDLATIQVAEHRYLEAGKNLVSAVSEYDAAKHPYGKGTALMHLMDLYLAQNRFQEALDYAGQALKVKEETAEAEDVARIQFVRAGILWKLDRLEDARVEIEKTIAIIESERLHIEKFDSRAQYFAYVHEYYSLYIQLLMALHELHPAARYDRIAFEAAEKSKVRALLDILSASGSSLPCEQLLSETPNPDLLSPNRAAKTKDAAFALTLAETQGQILDSSTVLLEYSLGDEASYAWVVDTAKISAFKLAPARRIRRAVQLFRESLVPLHPVDGESAVQFLQRLHAATQNRANQRGRLFELLLAPLDLPSEKRVLLVPDGPLQYISFALLRTGSRAAPFLQLHELVMLPSASVLAALRRSASVREPPTDAVVVFADPVFENPRVASAASSAVNSLGGRSRELQRALQDFQGSQRVDTLPGSRDEALAIQEIFGSSRTRLALKFDATREAVLDGSLSRPRIIHFATHGIVDTNHPELSGLILSLFNKNGESQDGYLRLSDIYNLKLAADLVVLSSCESALGKDLESEGIIGLPRGFLYAGARSVIASLWKVDDDATAALMKALYSRMRRGESPSDALRRAQLDLMKGTRFSDPYYWGAFVLEGDYK